MNQNEQQARMNELITRRQEQEKQTNETLETMKDKKTRFEIQNFFFGFGHFYICSFFQNTAVNPKRLFLVF